MTPQLNRRDVWVGAAAGAAVIAMDGARHLSVSASPLAADLVLFDSRLVESQAFARQEGRRPAPTVDIAGEDALFWRTARDGFGLAAGRTLVGMTLWSDWISLRSVLEPLGWRLVHEMRADFQAGSGEVEDPWRHLVAKADGPLKDRRTLAGPRDLTVFTWVMR